MTIPRILIADDDQDWVKKIAYPLKREGYDVDSVSTYKEVQSRLQRAKIDLMCLDVELDQSKIDDIGWGIDFTNLLGDAENRNIPVILITGHEGHEQKIKDRAIRYKTVEKRIFFKQDLDRKELINTIKEILKMDTQNIKLSHKDCKQLRTLLTQLPQWQNGLVSERNVLLDSGLPENLIHQIQLTGVPATDASTVMYHLENYGTLEERLNYKATGALVEYLIEYLGPDNKEFLVNLITTYNLINGYNGVQKPILSNRKEYSMDTIMQKRLKDLKELLELAYDRLGEYEKELQITASAPAKLELKQRIKRECLPDIRKYETEYATLLAENVEAFTLSDAEAEEVMLALQNAIDQKALPSASELPQEVTQAIAKAQETLKQPNVSAKSKLKMALPLIPGILSYEVEVDPSGAFVKVWQKIKTKFKL